MQPRLVMLNGPQPGATVSLNSDVSAFSIGRDASREVPVDDHQASRLHARVWFDGCMWQIEDCGSLNGTFVNTQSVQRTILESGDLIRIGDRLLVFVEESSELHDKGTHPSAFAAATTRTIRVEASSDEPAILEELASQTETGPLRSLSLLCRFATAVQAQADVDRLGQLVCSSLQEATQAGRIDIWLAGGDGRLQRAAGSTGVIEDAGQEHLLASVVMENSEGILMDLAASTESSATSGQLVANGHGSVMGVPVPGHKRPRGAIELHEPSREQGFTRDDLEFAVAVAHQFGMALENLEYREQLEQTNEQLRRRVSSQTRLLGDCPPMQLLREQVARVAPTSSTVLVLGESGTGKELVSQTIHQLSPRSSGPFVAVNCAAFSESLLESELFGHEPGAFTGADQRRLGQFERAHRGTIFLDELGEMSSACQAKLLRLLEGHPFERLGGSDPISVDVRLVAATNRDLNGMAKKGQFREDLYYRLRVIELPVPPLRDRDDDILDLAVGFLERYRREVGRGPRRFSREASEAILSYRWPGNVRELKNAVERAVVLGRAEEVLVDDLGLLPAGDSSNQGAQLVTLDEAEKRHIELVLRSAGGNKTRACQILGIGRGTLYKKLQSLQSESLESQETVQKS